MEIVAALTKDGVIGKDGTLPWRLKEELQHFKALTKGGVVVMGRKTFESIGKPLPYRENVVISNTLQNDDVIVVPSFEEAVEKAQSFNKPVFFIGGHSVYERALAVSERMHLSRIKDSYEGDVYFPRFSGWKKVKEEDKGSFVYEVYER